ncbi:MAG: hypothetical protein IPK50_02740 [Fibrobacterota bacterium]|nr:MAG: hypothetical protein IPK50_02740 [Fibrobacterota bacterium]
MGLEKKACVGVALVLSGWAVAGVPVTFKAGDLIKAAEVNANFATLDTALANNVERLSGQLAQLSAQVQAVEAKASQDSLSLAKSQAAQVASLQAAIQSLQTKASRDSAALAGSLQSVPLVSVIGLLTAPAGDGYMPGSNSVWLYAAGQGVVNGVTVPDLRGVFLRGMESKINIAGTATDYVKRDSLRTAGDFQGDAFQGHWHQSQGARMTSDLPGSGYSFSGLNYGANVGQDGAEVFSGTKNIREPIADGPNGTPRTTTETRPKNVALYWYVKVR